MITINKTYKFTGSATATTVTYTWESANECAGVTPSSGTITSGQTVDFVFTYEDEACTSTEFTLSTYDNVCETPVEQTYSYANPCTSLSASVKQTTEGSNPFVFTVLPTGGTSPYNIQWVYNTAVFQPASQNSNTPDNILYLEIKPSVTILPSAAKVTANITDANGCTVSVEKKLNLCQPTVTNALAEAICIVPFPAGNITANTLTGDIELSASECSGTTIDWSTIQLSYDTSKLFVQTNLNIMTVYAIAGIVAQTYNITYTVKNSIGVTSTEGVVTVSVPVCTTDSLLGPSMPTAISKKFASGATSGDTLELQLENIISA